MDRNITNAEFFDKYLKDKLSESERSALEEQASYDPLLQSEIKLQKEIYTALAEERKIMLKNRLNQIPVSGDGWFSSQSIRWAAAISSMLLATAGTYYYIDHDQSNTDQPYKQTVDITDEAEVVEFNQKPGTIPVPEPVASENSDAKIEQRGIASDHAQQDRIEVAETPVVRSIESLKSEASNQENNTITLPEIKHPNLSTSFTENSRSINYDDFTAPDRLISENNHLDHPLVDIETNNDKRYNFHYRYEDGKLYLYGGFNEALYRVIALNRKKDKSLFLEYEGNFYILDDHATEITPLELIRDSTLIKQLRKISAK